VWLDHWVAMCLVPLACWILLSGLDDIWISAVYLVSRGKRFPWPTEADLEHTDERRVAVFVPLWREHRVIGRMLEHNLSSVRYSNYDIFVGVYPNDELTERAVAEAARADRRVHLAVCPHNGPTSKGDCLNWIYRRMQNHERRERVRYEIILTHDAEDLMHPDSLRLINWYSRQYDMVQVPVLALPTPPTEWTHGIYCDEFAESQTKDIPVRQKLGGFLPSSGVGTGFDRASLERLAASRDGKIFDPASLTEDYENGLRFHLMGLRQVFLPIVFDRSGAIATREYFPRSFRAAVRQRSRWVAGIALQGWQHHGWRVPARQVYWLWRDRKGLIGNLLSPAANLVSLYMTGSWITGRHHFQEHIAAPIQAICAVVAGFALLQTAVRAHCCARVYGWRMAAWTPLRVLWANQINGLATIAALHQFFRARFRRRSLAWRKTEHVYPVHRAERQGRPRLGEVLVGMRRLSVEELEEALRSAPPQLRLGEHLVLSRKLSEDDLYEALSVHAGVPLGRPPARELQSGATRAIPASAARRWRVLPYRVAMGQLHLLTAEVPDEAMSRELSSLSGLEIRFRLVPPSELAELTERYLGKAV
jgi:adsorption protein B